MGKTHTFGYKTIPLYYENLPFKINLKTVCASSITSAKNAAERMGYENYTDNFDDIINDDSIDIVDICTPNYLHADEIFFRCESKKSTFIVTNRWCRSLRTRKKIADLEKKITKKMHADYLSKPIFPCNNACKKDD
ncbi:MAG: Gfo/Idh/MocA family oxidoreductase [Clostridiales bacterium]|nr:MAG: Gfo/Idh/MocA family oxidoreductase [Clostridiales bacterium]